MGCMNESTEIFGMRKKGLVLDWRLGTRFKLWMSCGHSAGEARAGEKVGKRKCRLCAGAYNDVVRAEPVP